MTSSPPLATAANPTPNLRRNFRLGVLNGALFTFAETLTDPSLVLAWFLDNLAASNVIIGLVAPLRDAGWYLPQLLTSHRLGYMPFKMPVYRQATVVRTATWVAMTAGVFIFNSPPILIAWFLVMYIINSLASGVAGLPFMDITAKTIPPRQRGRYFGERLFWGGLLGIGGGYLVKLGLENGLGLEFPGNVGMLMLGTTIIATLGQLVFIQTTEPPSPAAVEMATLKDHLRLAARLPDQDHNFRLYLIARSVMIIGGVAAPFLALYATRALAAGAGMIGIYLGVRTAASLASNRLWSRLSEQHSGRLVMQASSIQALAAMIIALALAPLARLLALPSNTWPWLFAIVFGLIGSSGSAIGVAGSSMMLNLSPDNQRAIYVGFANTVLGVAMFITSFGGLVVDLAGYEGMFALAGLCYLVGIVATAGVKEPSLEGATL